MNKKKFVDILFDIRKVEKKIGFNISQNQKFIEYSPHAVKYLEIIAQKIKSNDGGILIIDYGYWEEKMKNTLKSISNHRFNDVLKNFTKADITYDINFRLLENILKNSGLKINGKNNQKIFLENLGINKRAEIISKNLPFLKKVDIFYRLKKLTDKKMMGEVFKVVFATNKNINFQAGFIN